MPYLCFIQKGKNAFSRRHQSVEGLSSWCVWVLWYQHIYFGFNVPLNRKNITVDQNITHEVKSTGHPRVTWNDGPIISSRTRVFIVFLFLVRYKHYIHFQRTEVCFHMDQIKGILSPYHLRFCWMCSVSPGGVRLLSDTHITLETDKC